MASTSSSATTHYKYDLFLSFRGEDTRNSFTDHLYKALLQAGITTFRDDDEIREGQQLKPEIKRSIRKSRVSIVVFSENFANSSWCLDELSLIIKQWRKGHHFVLPVFYKVDPSDVRNQRGSFNIKTKEGVKWTEENVKRWKKALKKVGNLKGMVVTGSETAFIADVVHKIYRQLDLKLLSIPTNLPGIETRAGAINTWLKNQQPVIAICGMGGIGKTTLAKYIYNSNKQNFDCSSFLEGISDQPGVLLGLQNQLLRDVSGNNIPISNVSEGAFKIEKVIQGKKALIVVDDIDDKDQLSTLFGTTALHTQSKIIITTRLLNIDTWFESISYGCQVHKAESLNPDESLELLSYHAFGSKIPSEGFEDVALRLAQYCEGNPLALKVLGSSLMGTRIETWRSRVNSLNSLKGDLDSKIQGVLQKSYDTLACDSHKELFLHIACLFLGEYVSDIKKLLEDDYYAASGMVTLHNRCLLTFSYGCLTMHKLLQDMAGKIVRKNSKDRVEHSKFVWRHDDYCSLLRKGNGSEKIEGLVMYGRGISEMKNLQTFETSSLVKMKNLKYLQLDYVKLTGSYENFPDLRWLRWNGCNMKTISSDLLMSSLVVVDMRFSYLEEFDPPKVLNSLKILNLRSCKKLVSICNLIRLPKLEALLLANCISLTNVCKTIGGLENLSYLELAGCTKLWNASSNEMFVNQLKWLKTLCISVGIREQPLCSLPQSLSWLDLTISTFKILPRYIDLKNLRVLYLTYCLNLESIPCLPSKLEKLYVDWCSSLENITFESSRFTLSEFSYEGCFKLCEVEGLFKLVSIEKVDEVDLEHMLWIKEYQDHKVDLIGDVITKGRTFNIQMLYEYGIKSTYLQGIKDQSMKTHEYTSSSGSLSFRVPLHPKNHRIQGLNVTILYRSSSDEDRNIFAKIKNITKGVVWVYNPLVFCKPRVDEDVVWLSYWPMKNIFDTGDEVVVSIYGMIAGECGVSLVYMDDGEVEKGERMDEKEGDMSGLEVTKGCYYLCRRNFFNSMIPGCFFGDNIEIRDSRRWRSWHTVLDIIPFRNTERHNIEGDFVVSFNSESRIDKIKKAVCNVVGVESVTIKKEVGRLYVRGRFNPKAVVTCVREFEKTVLLVV